MAGENCLFQQVLSAFDTYLAIVDLDHVNERVRSPTGCRPIGDPADAIFAVPEDTGGFIKGEYWKPNAGPAAEPIIASVSCYVGNPPRLSDFRKVQQMAQWLIIVSWVSVILGLLTALAIAVDVTAHPQHMKIMNVVWPITGLYLPVLGWLLYVDMARRTPMSMSMDMHAAHGGCPFWKSVFVSTTHCAAGCVIGDIVGAPIAFWAGWTLFGERLYAEFLVLFVLAYVFGIAFQYLPIRAVRRISRRMALLEAIKADTLALTAFEIGLFAWMAVVYFQFVSRPELTSPTYWFMMQIGMVLGFIASFPVNWYLVRAGVKPGM